MKILLATASTYTTKLAVKFLKASKMDLKEVEIVIISVFPTVISAITRTTTTKKDIKEEYCEYVNEAEKIFKEIGINIKAVLKEGIPSVEILSLAEEEKVDLIILGGEKRRAWERFIIGSVADQVIKNAKIPIIILR